MYGLLGPMGCRLMKVMLESSELSLSYTMETRQPLIGDSPFLPACMLQVSFQNEALKGMNTFVESQHDRAHSNGKVCFLPTLVTQGHESVFDPRLFSTVKHLPQSKSTCDNCPGQETELLAPSLDPFPTFCSHIKHSAFYSHHSLIFFKYVFIT